MKPNTSSKNTPTMSAVNSKGKKSSKDREKRKSQSNAAEKAEAQTDKASTSKDVTRKYAGISPDSIICYSEQTASEHLSEDVIFGFAEDLSYRLRLVMNDALIKARLCGRNEISSSDIDATLDNMNIERIYGATANPNWMPLSDQNIYYLDDQVVNLIEIAENDETYLQPQNLIIAKKWLPDSKDVGTSFQVYFQNICFVLVSGDSQAKQFALQDVQQNTLIGPIIEWFYHFGFLLLTKDITYDSLTISALELIKALEGNPIAVQIVSEKQLALLTRLILQRVLRSNTTLEVLKQTCQLLAILISRNVLKQMVIHKVEQKLLDVKQNFLLPILSVINCVGLEAIQRVFIPNITYILCRITNERNPDLGEECLKVYDIICYCGADSNEIHKLFFEHFGDSLIKYWKAKSVSIKSSEYDETNYNWLETRVRLIKTRKKVVHLSANNKEPSADMMFENSYLDKPHQSTVNVQPLEEGKFKNSFRELNLFPEIKPKSFFDTIVITRKNNIIKYNPPVREELDLKGEFFDDFLLNVDNRPKIKQTEVVVGKRSLLLPVLRKFKKRYTKCNDHSIAFLTL